MPLSLLEISRQILPPFLYNGMRKCRNSLFRTKPLFDGDGARYMELMQKAVVYGEYGVGQSTQYVYEHTHAKIRSVDTSQEWINTVLKNKNDKNRIRIEYVDVGPLGNWGRPTGFTKQANFPKYVQSIWSYDEKPDIVLVDGRFRVSCFLYSLAMAKPGSIIIIDDYIDRPNYHIVEEFLAPLEYCGRQAIFIVPENVNKESCLKVSEKFNLVID